MRPRAHIQHQGSPKHRRGHIEPFGVAYITRSQGYVCFAYTYNSNVVMFDLLTLPFPKEHVLYVCFAYINNSKIVIIV